MAAKIYAFITLNLQQYELIHMSSSYKLVALKNVVIVLCMINSQIDPKSAGRLNI